MADMNKALIEAERAAQKIFEEMTNIAFARAKQAALDVLKRHGIEIAAECIEFHSDVMGRGKLIVRPRMPLDT